MDEENVVVNEVESKELPDVSSDVTTDEGQNEENAVDNQEVQEEIAESDDETPFPKKAVNAISRREKKIEKLRAELEQVRAQLQQTASKEQPKEQSKDFSAKKEDSAPNPDDYQTWDDYLEAKVEYGVRSALEKRASQEKQSEVYQKEKEYYDQRIKDFDSKEDQYFDKIPDFEKLSNKFTQTIASNLSVDVRKAILDSEDGPLALYTLMKEGRIDELEDMDGRQALRFLAKAEVRGQKYLENTKKVSSAPKPLQAVKGTGTFKKDIVDMSPDEIVNKYRNY